MHFSINKRIFFCGAVSRSSSVKKLLNYISGKASICDNGICVSSYLWHCVGSVALTRGSACALIPGAALPLCHGSTVCSQRDRGQTVPPCCARSDFDALNEEDVVKNNQLAFDVAEQEFGIPPVTTGQELGSAGEPDKLSMVLYLSKFYELFRGTPLQAVGKARPLPAGLGTGGSGSTPSRLLTSAALEPRVLSQLSLSGMPVCKSYLGLNTGKGEKLD